MGDQKKLILPELTVGPQDRIALFGANGTGKSTLLDYLIDGCLVEPEETVYLPQEISIEQSKQIMRDVKTLNHDQLGHIMTIVSRLGTRPERLLETELPSPGEIRKILLALGIIRAPSLIIMDEPTNHLDLPSIECLEQMLVDCPCALLLVSHDQAFLDRLSKIYWKLSVSQKQPAVSVLSVE